MRTPVLTIIFLVGMLCARADQRSENRKLGTIEGSVYDLHGAVIINVRISIENMDTGEVTSVRTDDTGRYSKSVKDGRYRVTMQPSPGYPIGYEHSSFAISRVERLTINFRPRPFSISDSIEGGRWVERYEGSLPSTTTHLVQQRDGTIKDVRIQYELSERSSTSIQYKVGVIASFDRFTVYAEKVVLELRRGKLLAEGDVLFEDGQRVRKVKRVEIDLLSGAPAALSGGQRL